MSRPTMGARRQRLLDRGWSIAFAACCGCSASPPSAPSTSTVAGSYSLSLTRCGLPREGTPAVPMIFVCSSENRWNLSQSGDEVSGRTEGQCPPFNWSGTLTGRTVAAGNSIVITALAYHDSSSHSQIQTLSLSGSGFMDVTGFSGSLRGDYSSQPVFGGAAGPVTTCHGTELPFRFSRQQ